MNIAIPPANAARYSTRNQFRAAQQPGLAGNEMTAGKDAASLIVQCIGHNARTNWSCTHGKG